MNLISRQFIAQEILAAACLVMVAIGVSENRAFAAELVQPHHDLAQVVFVSAPLSVIDAGERYCASRGAAANGFDCLTLANIPTANHVRQIEGRKRNVRFVEMMTAETDGVAGDLEAVATCPNAAVNPNLGKSFGEPLGSGDDVTVPSPKLLAIPHDAAIPDFLLPKPAANPLTCLVNGKCHLAFVNHSVAIIKPETAVFVNT